MVGDSNVCVRVKLFSAACVFVSMKERLCKREREEVSMRKGV